MKTIELINALFLLLCAVSCTETTPQKMKATTLDIKHCIHLVDVNIYVWDCVGIREGQHILHAVEGSEKRKIGSGPLDLVFTNGVSLKSDGKRVSIDGKPLPPHILNVTIRGTGYVVGAFVRTFR